MDAQACTSRIRLGFLTKYDAAKTAVAAQPSQAFINALQSMESIQLLERKSALRRHEFFRFWSSEVAGLPVGCWREMQIGNGGKRSDFSGIAIVKLETFEGVRVQFEMDVLGEITDHILFRE